MYAFAPLLAVQQTSGRHRLRTAVDQADASPGWVVQCRYITNMRGFDFRDGHLTNSFQHDTTTSDCINEPTNCLV